MAKMFASRRCVRPQMHQAADHRAYPNAAVAFCEQRHHAIVRQHRHCCFALGNVSGNVSSNVSSNVSGNVSGNAPGNRADVYGGRLAVVVELAHQAATHRADPGAARRRRKRGDVGALRPTRPKVTQRPATRIPCIHAAAACSHPHHAAPILIQRHDVAVRQAIGAAVVIGVLEPSVALIEQIQTVGGADPEAPLVVFEQDTNIAIAQAGVRFRIMSIRHEALPRGIEAAQTLTECAHPKLAIGALENVAHLISTEA